MTAPEPLPRAVGGFRALPEVHGRVADLAGDPFPTDVRAFRGPPLHLPAGGTHFGFVHRGAATLECASGAFDLREGMYFAVPGEARLAGGRGIAVTRLGFLGLFALGGPIEDRGRLRYIDGCTDSLVLPPVVRGDPCLNLLHIPAGTRQSRHTHPSLRAGVVARGRGRCVTVDGAVDLQPGLAFVIDAGAEHAFHADGEALVVVAWHPDSDFGPTDADHPMINRTWLSASG